MLELIESSKRDVIDLYGKLSRLDRSWKGTLIITLVQYLFAISYERNNNRTPSSKFVASCYDKYGMKSFVDDVIQLRNDVCHRCGMCSTNESLDIILFSNSFRRLLEICDIIKSEPKNVPESFTAAIKMSGD